MIIQQRSADNWTPRQKENFLEDLFLATSISRLCETIFRYYLKKSVGRLTFAIIGAGGWLSVFEDHHGEYAPRRLVSEIPYKWGESAWVADLLKRPLGPHKVFELSLEDGIERLVFITEHGDNHTLPFFESIQELLKVSFTSLLVKHRMEDASEQWAATFEFMKDPVMVISADRRIVRSNSAEKEAKHCYQILGEERPCNDCPLGVQEKAEIMTSRGRFTVLSHRVDFGHEAEIYIHHYKDVSRDRHLYSQVVQNQKMAAVGLLAGNIAHELSNPLAGIKSLIETVKLDVDTESEHLKDFDEIRDAAIRCQKIIQNLLTFAFETGPQELEVFDPVEVVQRTIPLLKIQLRDHHVDVESGQTISLVKGRLSAFQQVVFNLLNNAGQAMESNGTIRVQFFEKLEAIEILFTDTGGGISESHIGKIFDPFFTTKKPGEGTGLGLSVARNLMQEMHGDLEFLGNDRLGAIFKVTLSKAYV